MEPSIPEVSGDYPVDDQMTEHKQVPMPDEGDIEMCYRVAIVEPSRATCAILTPRKA